MEDWEQLFATTRALRQSSSNACRGVWLYYCPSPMHTEEQYLTAAQGLGGHSIAPVLKQERRGTPLKACFGAGRPRVVESRRTRMSRFLDVFGWIVSNTARTCSPAHCLLVISGSFGPVEAYACCLNPLVSSIYRAPAIPIEAVICLKMESRLR